MMEKFLGKIRDFVLVVVFFGVNFSVYSSDLTKGIGLTPEMLTWKKFEFVNGGALIELPAKPHLHNGIYAKFFFTKKGSWPAGDYPISELSIRETPNKSREEFDNSLKIERFTVIREDGWKVLHRRIFFSLSKEILITSSTDLREKFFAGKVDSEKRMKYDDEIFDRAVESIQLKGADGKYYKPKIIRLPEEIKDFTKKVKKKPVFKKANAQAVK